MRPITVSITGTGTSPLVRLDEWAAPKIGIQCNVTGTVNYTVQSSMDDPNSPTNPVALGSMTWINSADTNAVAATAAIQTSYDYCPLFARILVNSGTGTVSATFVQPGVAPY